MAKKDAERAQREIEECRRVRADLEGRWAAGLAGYDGRQSVVWNSYVARFEKVVLPAEMKDYRVYNLMKPLILFLVARATMNHPDVAIQGDEGAMVNDHYDRLFDSQTQIRKMCAYNLKATTAFLKQSINRRAVAEIVGPEGEPVKAPVGDCAEDWIPGHEVYYWPTSAKDWKEARRVYHVSLQPIDEMRERHAALRRNKTLDSVNRWLQGFFTLLATASGGATDVARTATPKGMVEHVECYEMPGPESSATVKLTCYVNGETVYEEDLGIDFCPLLPLSYDPGTLIPWGEGPAYGMLDSNISINLLMSKATTEVRSRKLNITGQWGDGQSKEAGKTLGWNMSENPHVRNVKVRPGAPMPQMVRDPAVGGEIITLCDKHFENMQQIAGVRGPSVQSDMPNLSGVAMQLALDNDQTQTAPYLREIEAFLVERARRRLVLAAKLAEETPDVVRVWRPGDGEERYESTLEELRENHGAPVSIETGSATLLSQAALEEQAREMLAAFPFDNPLGQEVFLELCKTGGGRVFAAAYKKAKDKAMETMEEQAGEDLDGDMEEGEDPDHVAAVLGGQVPGAAEMLRGALGEDEFGGEESLEGME